MKKVLYNEEEIELIKELKSAAPVSIWCNYVSYYFVYEDFYLKISMADQPALTQNRFDEILHVVIQKVEKIFVPTESDELICENNLVTNIWIMRTLLYFEDVRKLSKLQIFWNKTKYKLKSLIYGKDGFQRISSGANAVWAEVICNPNSNEAKQVNPEFSNLVDTGLLIEMDEHYLKAYADGNGFGFDKEDGSYLIPVSKLFDESEFYEAIKVE